MKMISDIKISQDMFMPIRVTDPISITNVSNVSRPAGLTGHTIGKGDAPRCSREAVRHFEENWENILPPRVVKSIKRNRDVMHGARSVNMIVGKQFSRPTKDFDVYSREPAKRANQIENEIDKCMHCDMAYVYYQPIPKFNVFSQEDKFMAKELYIVKTVPHHDGDIDYMLLPRGLPYHKRKGIYHEDLEEAYRKAEKNLIHPLRSAKSRRDMERIKAYWRSRGKKV